ncbi:hypothetical protein BU15DRAFT_67653 [Melanogaster broomeanus]|nr:hypothetical protein BU15DRAFT_67653 [Melanogaster broomeanus]
MSDETVRRSVGVWVVPGGPQRAFYQFLRCDTLIIELKARAAYIYERAQSIPVKPLSADPAKNYSFWHVTSEVTFVELAKESLPPCCAYTSLRVISVTVSTRISADSPSQRYIMPSLGTAGNFQRNSDAARRPVPIGNTVIDRDDLPVAPLSRVTTVTPLSTPLEFRYILSLPMIYLCCEGSSPATNLPTLAVKRSYDLLPCCGFVILVQGLVILGLSLQQVGGGFTKTKMWCPRNPQFTRLQAHLAEASLIRSYPVPVAVGSWTWGDL